MEDNRVTLINLYGPNQDDPEFYDQVRETLLEFDNQYFIVLGDFNLVLNQLLDTHNYSGVNNPKAREKLLEIMDDSRLLDYYRVLNPEKKVFTWRKKTPFKQARIDYILISESLSNIVEKFSIKPGYRSDHSIVLMELKFNSFERGRGLWKFNNSLLTDPIFIEKVKDTIQKVKQQYLETEDGENNQTSDIINHSTFLEVLLMEIRGITISYSSYKKKETNKLENSLIEEIGALESEQEINIDLVEQK